MKKLFLGAFLIIPTIFAMDAQKSPDQTEKYRKTKAHEAIIHDTYKEAVPFDQELPPAYKDTLKKFGLSEKDVHFYTAVRMNRFVKKVGNNIVLLRPNFFLYLTEQEQAAVIGYQLARIKAGDNRELDGKKHNPNKTTLSQFRKASIAIGSVLLAGLYHQEIIKSLPYIKNALCSKAAMVISGFLAANIFAKALYKHTKLKREFAYELASIDVLGAQDMIRMKERQIVWGKNNSSWIRYQWDKFLGRLYLAGNPEASLERINEHLNEKTVANQ